MRTRYIVVLYSTEDRTQYDVLGPFKNEQLAYVSGIKWITENHKNFPYIDFYIRTTVTR